MCYDWPAEFTNLFIPLRKPHRTRLLFPSLHTIVNPLLNTRDSHDFCTFFPFDFEPNHNGDLVWKFSTNFGWILMLWTCSSPLLIGFPSKKNFWLLSFSSHSAFTGFCTTNEGSPILLFHLLVARGLESEAITVFCFSPLIIATKEWETFKSDYGCLCIPSKIFIGFLGVIKLCRSKSNPFHPRITFPFGMITNLLWPPTLSSVMKI